MLSQTFIEKEQGKLGMVTNTCNLSTQEAKEAGRSRV